VHFPPEQVFALAPEALVHARLGVPGQGVFSASAVDVCIRGLSRFRDQLQYFQGYRALSRERLERLRE